MQDKNVKLIERAVPTPSRPMKCRRGAKVRKLVASAVRDWYYLLHANEIRDLDPRGTSRSRNDRRRSCLGLSRAVGGPGQLRRLSDGFTCAVGTVAFDAGPTIASNQTLPRRTSLPAMPLSDAVPVGRLSIAVPGAHVPGAGDSGIGGRSRTGSGFERLGHSGQHVPAAFIELRRCTHRGLAPTRPAATLLHLPPSPRAFFPSIDLRLSAPLRGTSL